MPEPAGIETADIQKFPLTPFIMLSRSKQAAFLVRSNLRSLASSASGRSTTSLARQNGLRSEISHIQLLRKPSSLALAIRKPLSTSLQRYATSLSGSPYDTIDKKHEEAVEQDKIEPHPNEVTATSSVHQVFQEKGVEEAEKEEDMLAGVKEDLVRPC